MLRAPLPRGSVLDWRVMVTPLAAEPPWWPPGSGHGYRVNTFGFLAGEVIRRVTGASMGAMLEEEIAGPLGADVHIGLPAAEHARVTDFTWPDPGAGTIPPGAAGVPPGLLVNRNAYANPPGLSGMGVVNTPAWRRAEVPSANAHAQGATRFPRTRHPPAKPPRARLRAHERAV